jgi:hypothetical protein
MPWAAASRGATAQAAGFGGDEGGLEADRESAAGIRDKTVIDASLCGCMPSFLGQM